MKKVLFTLLCLSGFHSVYSQLPTALFSIADSTICQGTCTDYINQSTNATSYYWIFEGGVADDSFAMDPSPVCYAYSGYYDVTLIAINSSGSDTFVIPNCIYIYPLHPIGVIQNGDTLRTDTGFMSYQWYLNGIQIPGATDSIYIASVTGDYAVVATDSNGCEVEARMFEVYAEVGEIANDLNVSPIPASEYLEIKGDQFTGEIEIRICNTLGSVVKSEIMHSKSEMRVNLNGLLPGIYFVDIKSGKYSWAKRIIKE